MPSVGSTPLRVAKARSCEIIRLEAELGGESTGPTFAGKRLAGGCEPQYFTAPNGHGSDWAILNGVQGGFSLLKCGKLGSRRHFGCHGTATLVTVRLEKG